MNLIFSIYSVFQRAQPEGSNGEAQVYISQSLSYKFLLDLIVLPVAGGINISKIYIFSKGYLTEKYVGILLEAHSKFCNDTSVFLQRYIS